MLVGALLFRGPTRRSKFYPAWVQVLPGPSSDSGAVGIVDLHAVNGL